MGDVIQFEAIKNGKQWEDEYPKFLGHIEKYFGTKTDPGTMFKRMYYAIRFLEGVVNSFMIFSLMGIPIEENKRGKQFLIEWLEDIVDKLKQY